MINYIWVSMMIISIITAVFLGKTNELTSAIYQAGDKAIELCISLTAIMGFWGGIMKIAEKSNVTSVIGKILSPFIKIIFPGLDTKSAAAKAISISIAANMLGLGNAATPLGIEAMKQLKALSTMKDTASNHMITFVMLNTASIQLIPTTISAIRTKYGASNPMDIAPMIIIASILSLITGLIINRIIISSSKRRFE